MLSLTWSDCYVVDTLEVVIRSYTGSGFFSKLFVTTNDVFCWIFSKHFFARGFVL